MIDGKDELLRQLRQYPQQLQERPLLRATAAAAQVFRDTARQYAPRGTGQLKRDIAMIRDRTAAAGQVRFNVTLRGRSFYGRFPETGTKHQRAQRYLSRAEADSQARAAIAFRDRLQAELNGMKP